MKVALTFTDNSDVARRGIKLAAIDGLFIAADETTGYIKEGLLRGPKSGRTYTKKDPKRTHIASRAGEYPATDLGTLQQSLGAEKDFDAVYITSSAKYAVQLEFRPPQRGGRPFITRGIIERQDRIGDVVTSYIKRSIDG
jgi:hypothetical protein